MFLCFFWANKNVFFNSCRIRFCFCLHKNWKALPLLRVVLRRGPSPRGSERSPVQSHTDWTESEGSNHARGGTEPEWCTWVKNTKHLRGESVDLFCHRSPVKLLVEQERALMQPPLLLPQSPIGPLQAESLATHTASAAMGENFPPRQACEDCRGTGCVSSAGTMPQVCERARPRRFFVSSWEQNPAAWRSLTCRRSRWSPAAGGEAALPGAGPESSLVRRTAWAQTRGRSHLEKEKVVRSETNLSELFSQMVWA